MLFFVYSFVFRSFAIVVHFVFFFFKQKTAYEMLRSLVGSEMCIRDSPNTVWNALQAAQNAQTQTTAQNGATK